MSPTIPAEMPTCELTSRVSPGSDGLQGSAFRGRAEAVAAVAKSDAIYRSLRASTVAYQARTATESTGVLSAVSLSGLRALRDSREPGMLLLAPAASDSTPAPALSASVEIARVIGLIPSAQNGAPDRGELPKKLDRLMARSGHEMVTVETKPESAVQFGPLMPGGGKTAVQLNTALAMLSAGAHMYLNIGQARLSPGGSQGPFHAPLDHFADDLTPVLKRVEKSIGAKAEHVNFWLGAVTSPGGTRSQMHADPYDNVYFLLAGELRVQRTQS